MRLLRGWICALAVATAASACFASAAQAVPANFWGVDPQAAPTPEQFQRLKRGGVDSVRIPVAWASVQPTKNAAFDWSSVDAVVGSAAGAGLEVLPFLYGAPSWAVPSAVVPGSHGSYRAPKTLPVRTAEQRAAWAAFVQAAAARYGPEGTFWSEHHQLSSRPIRTWQIWNEANFKYFVTRPNPVDYGQLVKVSFAALRGVDPGARIVLAGLFSQPIEATFKVKPRQAYFAADFLEKMYRSTPGIKSMFQGVALHPYTGTVKRLTPEIEEFRRVLVGNHDAGKSLWITEIGWSSEPFNPAGHDAFAKGPTGQARELKAAFKLFAQRAARWRLRQVYWFSVEDLAGVCNFCGGSGLFSSGFVAKESWLAYVKFAGGQPS
jgi:hypothetical protein